jgi:hypothetical protein
VSSHTHPSWSLREQLVDKAEVAVVWDRMASVRPRRTKMVSSPCNR